jgi:hypothetical protein
MTMIGAKTCAKCNGAATVMLNDQPLCSEHAFEAIKKAPGPVPLPKPVK